jgi:hypothetical protein
MKAYTKGEHVLLFEAITHNTAELRCDRILDRFPQIVARQQAWSTGSGGRVTCSSVKRPALKRRFGREGVLERRHRRGGV